MTTILLQKFYRVDAVTQWVTKPKVEITSEGFWIVEGIAAKAGPLEYADSEGNTHTEWVSEETLRNSAAGLIGKPVVLEHPFDGKVDPKNFKTLNIGTVLEAWYNEEAQGLTVKMVINDEGAHLAILSGKVGLSPGYLAGLVEAPENIDADFVQTTRTYNHLAVVDEARGGDTVRLHLDSKGNITMKPEEDEKKEDGANPFEKKEDGENPYEKKEDGEMSKEDMMKKIDALQGKLDALMAAKKDSEEKEDADDDEKTDEKEEEKNDSADFAQRYAAHRRAIEVAQAHGIEVTEDTPTDQIQRAVVTAKVKTLRNDSRAYIDAAFDMIAQETPKANSVDHLSQAFRYDSKADTQRGALDLVDPLDQYRNRSKN